MTRNSALQIAIETINACDLSIFTDEQKDKISEALKTIATMREQLAKPRTNSTATNEKRRAATAEARAKIVAAIAPIVRKIAVMPMTAKEIFAASDEWPQNFTANKLQNVLIREMASELVKVEAKGKPNTYQIIG